MKLAGLAVDEYVTLDTGLVGILFLSMECTELSVPLPALNVCEVN